MDFIKDLSGRHLLHLNTLVQVPEFVKQAAVDEETVGQLPDHLFADPTHREFPLDSAGHVYLSHAYCLSAGVKNAHVTERIKLAARLFPELEAELPKLDAAYNDFQKSASAEKPLYAVYIDFGAEQDAKPGMEKKASGVQGFYNISTPDNVREAAQRLGQDKFKLPLEVFSAGCRETCKAAAAHGVLSELSETIKAYGVERLPDFEFVKSQCVQRVEQTGDTTYTDIADSAEADPDAGDWAGLWTNLDRSHGIKYARHTLDPYRVFNSGILKSAMDQELAQWTLLAGAAVPIAALQAISTDSIDQTFSKTAGDQIKALLHTKKTANDKIAAGLVSMDLPVQKALLKLALQ